uniref:Uncharacterized protein n=2 Tax=Populus trichocarpa TaxID=3694 RepID=A0A2K2CBR7_POPTR
MALLLLAPGAEKKTRLLLGRWGRDMARQATRTSCWCRGETGHSAVAEGYSAEAEAAKACSAVIGNSPVRRKIAGEPFLGAVLTEREGRLAEGENGGLLMRGRGRLAEGGNGGLLMRGKGCWRLGGSVTEISKAREAAGGWLRLEDERMKKRWKGRGAGVFFGRLRGRRKRREKAGLGEKGLLVLWSGLCGGAVAEMEK